MNKHFFYTGILMLLVPILFIGFLFLINLNINWTNLLIGFCILSYLIVSFVLISKGIIQDD